MIMKKMIILIAILMLVGCSKKTTCTKVENNERTSILITGSNDNIKEVKIKSEFENDEEATNYCTLLKLIDIDVECKNNLVIYKNYQDYLDITLNGRKELIEYLETNNYDCK